MCSRFSIIELSSHVSCLYVINYSPCALTAWRVVQWTLDFSYTPTHPIRTMPIHDPSVRTVHIEQQLHSQFGYHTLAHKMLRECCQFQRIQAGSLLQNATRFHFECSADFYVFPFQLLLLHIHISSFHYNLHARCSQLQCSMIIYFSRCASRGC